MTTTATSHRLTWGPKAGASVNALAATDEGRGHLVWISRHADAPIADRRAARAALAAHRTPLPQTPPLRRESRNVLGQNPRRSSRT
jgi:hypothetical protein